MCNFDHYLIYDTLTHMNSSVHRNSQTRCVILIAISRNSNTHFRLKNVQPRFRCSILGIATVEHRTARWYRRFACNDANVTRRWRIIQLEKWNSLWHAALDQISDWMNGCSILANLTMLNLFSLYNQLNNYNEQTKALIMYRTKLDIWKVL